MAATIRKRTASLAVLDFNDHPPYRRPHEHRGRKKISTDSSSQLSRSITSKVEDGNIRAAVRLLIADDKPAEYNDNTLKELISKHPTACTDRNLSALLPARDFVDGAFQVTEAMVLKAIRSFPPGSAGGPDGIRPQHLVEMLNNKDTHNSFLSSISSFMNLILRGQCPPEVAQILFGGNLLAIQKKSGGIRPIAVGYFWRRLASKCANVFAMGKLETYFKPYQLGVGVRGGCEAAVHACRRFLESMPDDQIVVKLDFRNAFNSLRRDAMLRAVARHVPELFAYCYSAYSGSSSLQFGSKQILSQEGIQQGDPLGPLLFCLTVHPALQTVNSPLLIGYMDDVTVGGPATSVANDLVALQTACASLGLELNAGKCEVISHPFTDLRPFSLMSNFQRKAVEEASLLGAPLGAGAALSEALLSKLDEIKLASSRLNLISSHDALTILKASCSASKLLFLLRSAPCVGHQTLASIDRVFRSSLSIVTNVDLSERQWQQASLPVKNGGLGIRSVVDLAPAAFLSSSISTEDTQSDLLVNCIPVPTDFHLTRIRSDWTATYGAASVPDVSSHQNQKAWDTQLVTAVLASLTANAVGQADKARLLAAAAPHSGDWLHALPISSCGLRLDDNALRVSVALRLGAKVCEPHICICGSNVDCFGSHALSCKKSPGRIIRHNNINDIVAKALHRAGVPTTKEPPGLSRSDGKRPDGITQIPWSGGRSAIWDVTVTDTLAISYLPISMASAGSAAEQAATRKEDKYNLLSNHYLFFPLAMESLGPICRKATAFLSEIGRRSSLLNDDPRETSFLFQRVAIAIQRFNAVMITGSFPPFAE